MHTMKSNTVGAAAANWRITVKEAHLISATRKLAGVVDPAEGRAIDEDLDAIKRGVPGLPRISKTAYRVLLGIPDEPQLYSEPVSLTDLARSRRPARSRRVQPTFGLHAESVFGLKVVHVKSTAADLSVAGVPKYYVEGPFKTTEGFPTSANQVFKVAFLGVGVPEEVLTATARGERVLIQPRAYDVREIRDAADRLLGQYLLITEVHRFEPAAG